MEGLVVYIWPVVIGAAYFALVSLFKKFTRVSYKLGLILPVGLVLFFLAMLLFVAPQDTTGWAGLGYVIMLVLTSVVLGSYLLCWLIVSLVNKNRSSLKDSQTFSSSQSSSDEQNRASNEIIDAQFKEK